MNPDVADCATNVFTSYLIVFFFQAEDGIRDLTVTGVQTCALPIWAELGHDAPAVAAKLQVLGTIFLRLIRVIIAPLLFAVLVVGIAGHPDLKKVGQIGRASCRERV